MQFGSVFLGTQKGPRWAMDASGRSGHHANPLLLILGISALLAWFSRLHWSFGSPFPNTGLVGACIPATLGLQSFGSPPAHRSPAHVSQSRWGRSVCGRNGPGGPGRRAIAAGLENFCVQ